MQNIEQRDLVCVRMEAIGGQGANSAGKILAEAAVLGHRYTGNHFSSFGSEKRGSPVRSFTRFSVQRKPVRSAAFIQVPNLLIVFHEHLLDTHAEIFAGVGEHTDILVNSKKSPEELPLLKEVSCRYVATIDASSIAQKKNCGLNVVMLGAALEFLPELESEKLSAAIQNFFSRLPKAQLTQNVDGFELGKNKVRESLFRREQALLNPQSSLVPDFGYEDAPVGGLITNSGNTVLKDHSVSRKGLAPKFLKEVCFNCGFCDMVCPDYCFVWKKDENGNAQLQGIDYQYCKACQKCVVACPVQALVLTPENEILEEDKTAHFLEKK